MADKSFDVRPIQHGDEHSIYSLLSLFRDESKISRNDPRHPSNAAKALVAARHDPEAKDCGWLAISDGKAVGLITTQDYSGGVIDPDYYSRRDIADALLYARDESMLAQGQTEARRDIRADNIGLLHASTREGYHFDTASKAAIDNLLGEIPHVNFYRAKPREDTNVPVLVLTKNLAESCLLARWRRANKATTNGDASSPSGDPERAEVARVAENERREEERDREYLTKLEYRFSGQIDKERGPHSPLLGPHR